MNSLTATLFILGTFLSTQCWSGRTLYIPPIDTPAGWTEDGSGTCWAGLVRTFNLVNISSVVQKIKITHLNHNLNFGSCDGATELTGNWVAGSIPHCKNVNNLGADLPPLEQSLTLYPFKSGTVVYALQCQTQRSGVSGCTYSLILTAANTTKTLRANIVQAAKSEHKIEIEENLGAILGTITGSASAQCNSFKSTTVLNMQLNGGRAF